MPQQAGNNLKSVRLVSSIRVNVQSPQQRRELRVVRKVSDSAKTQSWQVLRKVVRAKDFLEFLVDNNNFFLQNIETSITGVRCCCYHHWLTFYALLDL